jgi:hypothetical protein
MTIDVMPARLSREEMADLSTAVRLLEGDTLASRLTRVLGRQVEWLGRALPSSARAMIATATESALKTALRVALKTLDAKSKGKASNRWHKAAAAASGAIGGAFGFAALPIELPVSTTILLRSIADIAREYGEDLSKPEVSLACIEVFALGGPDDIVGQQPGEAAFEGGYFAVRGALAQSVSEGARFLLKSGLGGETAPVLVRLISQIAARFGVAVSEKLAAQAVPVLGAVGGAAVNAAFAEHFQSLARGHFIVRRLERAHGHDAVKFEYERLRHASATPRPHN